MENTLGQQLAALREAKGMTQEELAEKAGLSRPRISRLENDEVDAPRRSTLDKLARVLGVAPDTLKIDVLPVRRTVAGAAVEADQFARFENVILHEKITEQQDELASKDGEITRLKAMVAYLNAELGKFGGNLEAALFDLLPVGPRAGALASAG